MVQGQSRGAILEHFQSTGTIPKYYNALFKSFMVAVFGSLAESDTKSGTLHGPKANEHVPCRIQFGASFKRMLCLTSASYGFSLIRYPIRFSELMVSV